MSNMPAEVHESSGRTMSLWLSHEEIAALDRAAAVEKIKRNKAARRAIAAYVSAIADR